MSLFNRKSTTAVIEREPTRADDIAALATLRSEVEAELHQFDQEAPVVERNLLNAQAALRDAQRALDMVRGGRDGARVRLERQGELLMQRLRESAPKVLKGALNDVAEAIREAHTERWIAKCDLTTEDLSAYRESLQQAKSDIEVMMLADLPDAEVEKRLAAIAATVDGTAR